MHTCMWWRWLLLWGVGVAWENVLVSKKILASKERNSEQQQRKWSFICYTMEHEQSACTHTAFAHAVVRFQLALASDGI